MTPLHQVSLGSPSWGSTPYATSAEPELCAAAEPPVEEPSVSPLQPSTPVMNSSAILEKPFDALMVEVLLLLAQQEEKATLILRDAIYAEKQWQKSLSDLLEKEHATCLEYEKRNDLVHKASDIIVPLSLIAEGAIPFCAGLCVGTIDLKSLGAMALGGLLLLDTLLDNKAKQAVASVLGRGSEESTKTWFHRICMTTNFAIFGLSFAFSGNGAVGLASNASKTAVSCAEAGTEHFLNNQKAKLIENEEQWNRSGTCLRELLGDVDRQVKAVNGLRELLSDFQKSTTQATAHIF